MGAVKEMAIQLESNMLEAAEVAGACNNPGLAYRLGLLEACRLIGETQQYYLDTGEAVSPFLAVQSAWSSVYDAADYLADVARRKR